MILGLLSLVKNINFSFLTNPNFLKIVFLLSLLVFFIWQTITIRNLRKDNLEQSNIITKQNETIKGYEQDIKLIGKIHTDISKIDDTNSNRIKQTIDRINTYKTKNDIETKKNINEQSELRKRCFALATGSKPFYGEQNNICPDMVKQ